MLTTKQIKEIIINNKILSEKEFTDIGPEIKKSKLSLEEYLYEKKIISEDLFYEAVANYFNIPFINLKNKIILPDILQLIPESIAKTHKIIAFEKDDQILKLACLDPKNLEIFDFIERKTNLKLKIFITTPLIIKETLKQYRKPLETAVEKIIQPEMVEKIEGGDLSKLAQELPIIKIVDTLLDYAISENASDIHIEPMEKNLVIRFRVDGILKKVMELPKSSNAGVVARIKILSNLKIDEHRMPQDGRFKIVTPDYKFSFRVSVLPIFDGEKIVLRLLKESGGVLDLEQLGFLPKNLEIIKRNIKKPHGMILVTGPTGSGKTTTLYTILNILNTAEVNISTIEDPIEYRLTGINQSQVNPRIGYTFATGLRSLLRQDPNVIMVGEIRDNETANIAINAALTGHLVLSTLHTNDAITSLPRLLDMQVPAFLIASTINVIVAQRLARKICPNCIQSYNLDKKQIEELKKNFELDSIMQTLIREKIISPKEKNWESLLFYKGKGCKQCDNNGYKGRVGIYEVLELNEELRDLVTKEADTDQLKKITKKHEMITILEDAFIKAKNGLTSLEEIIRVTKE
ncbi:MAG: Type II secretion system protein E [Parcubacteria group bacterium Athens1014_10]|nr:MAG: Type II secretion system protein E [Parcubacteria group bacterium Athens1014_10]TSD06066.1 MAG: Type II secretion system protein E [Parcubacteria group bacterium Athens0714_12]